MRRQPKPFPVPFITSIRGNIYNSLFYWLYFIFPQPVSTVVPSSLLQVLVDPSNIQGKNLNWALCLICGGGVFLFIPQNITFYSFLVLFSYCLPCFQFLLPGSEIKLVITMSPTSQINTLFAGLLSHGTILNLELGALKLMFLLSAAVLLDCLWTRQDIPIIGQNKNNLPS